MTKWQELNEVFELVFDWEYLLSEIVYNFDQNIVFLFEKH